MADKLTEREGVGRVDGARTPEVAALMQDAVNSGECPFCSPRFEKTNGEWLIDFNGDSRAIVWSGNWHAWHNPSPMAGTEYHIMLASTEHHTSLTDLRDEEVSDLHDAIESIVDKYNIESYSLLVRTGERQFNSATVEHLHVHIIASDCKEVRFEDFSEHEIELMRSIEMLLPHGDDIVEEIDDLRELLDKWRAFKQGGKATPIRAKLSNKARP